VALEYYWCGGADIDAAGLRAFISTTTGGRLHPDGTTFLDGMYIMARTIAGDDEDSLAEDFGFRETFSATFRFANLAAPTVTEHNLAVMVRVLIAFARSHGGQGVLLFNYEEAVLLYGPDGIVFGSEWEDWTDNPETAPFLTRFASRPLPQPFL
jgi:hypothetical protein